MGKNNIENSLKRFLKRKVKITLGFVVAFMISGTVGFAADIDTDNYPLTDEGYKNALEYLNGLGQSNLTTGDIIVDSNSNIKIIVKEENGEYKISYSGISTYPNTSLNTATISKETLSEKTVNNLNKFLNSSNKEYKLMEESVTTDIAANQFIQNNKSKTAAQKATGNNEIVNNGYILATLGQVIENGKATNNGFIFTKNVAPNQFIGQQATGTGELYNNGYIGHSNIAQSVKNGNAYNYGSITTEFAQQSLGTGSLYNYGFMKGTGSGVEIYGQQITNSSAYNYGVIEAYRGAQGILSGYGKLYNYGTLIATNDKGEAQFSNSGTGENYGLIKVKNGFGMKGTGTLTNKGVIHSSESSNIFDSFNSNSINTGIVITNADVKDKNWAKTGVTLNGNYELQNTDTATIITGDTLNKESFGDKNIGYINLTSGNANRPTDSIAISNITAERDEEGNITDKKVLGVVTDENKTVFKADSQTDNLLLDGIDMTGYLMNGGTFIDMDGKDLILSDSNITVTEDLTKTKGEKAIAVDLGDTGKLTLMGESKVNGVIKGGANTKLESLAQKGEINTETEGVLEFKNVDIQDFKGVNYTDVNLIGKSAGSIKSEFTATSEGKENTINITKGFVVGKEDDDYTSQDAIVDTSAEGNKVNYIIEDIDNIHGNIKLGAGENTVTVNSEFEKYNGKIDLGAGDKDKFIVQGSSTQNRFDYEVWNAETIELNGGTWGDWANAQGKIHTEDKNNFPSTILGDDTTLKITINNENKGSDFANYINDKLEGNHITVSGTGNGSAVKYWIGDTGIDSSKFTADEYSIDKDKVEIHSPIFNVESNEKGTSLTLKTAEEIGAEGQHRIIYDAYINQIKSDVANENVITKINSFDTSEDFLKYIHSVHATGIAYYTAGSVVTKDITDTYLSSVEDFRKRAGKGEWLAQGKYINSDTEFDGGSKVKGYDGDVTGTMGMIEYGVTDSTAYGVAFGKGDSEMDIDGGGKLDGDNTYIGAYMKHRTQNGIELVGNIGYMKNDMDSSLRSDFNAPLVSDSTYEKGTADSSAVTLSLKGRKDYKISNDLRLQPTLAGRIYMINQEEAENQEMGFTVSQQDIIVLEATAGMGIAKDFTLSHGIFEVNGGVEYTFAASNTNNNAEYTLFGNPVKMEDVDMAENRGTIYFGADYEHENGVGINGKYEMMWSDKGDDSRITAGVSYRF